MTKKELKKLSRSELLEMLIARSKEAASLKEQLSSVTKRLNDRRIIIENAGSIAEASLQLNGVFEAAQNAAEQYLENVKKQADICAEMEKQSSERAEKILSDAEKKCADMEAETQKKCDEMIKAAELRAREYRDETSKKISQLLDAQAGLRELLNESKENK